ncbi:late expression factor-5 [Maruca vitrata nucleopolyhedrovirus]|uniref:Late expression factor-5 n=1 Tax=Maruca vitrata nucleopolyhedrovirus TaxID=1307954 RepID=A1YRD8_9ABAC|nr:late expression factor-5 [Maruca vitrata nucleopolyhedrovirus]ABL76028.1 late expression factor-5 [Maruca vitrata nucleopolyhedrovirus]
MPFDDGVVKTQTDPFALKRGGHNVKKWTSYSLFKIFKEFRVNKNYSKLIDFLTENFPSNVKNKTFNFSSTGHLFHSLHAYVPSVSDLVKERKQIRLQTEYLTKLFNNTINDFKLYTELYEFIERTENVDCCCPCQLLHKSLLNTKNYVENLNCKLFDIKPPKFKKEPFDNILYKYSLNYKSLLLKKKEKHTSNSCVRKKKIKHRQILNDKVIYLQNSNKNKLFELSGLSLKSCRHDFATVESQTRAGDEIASFIRYCRLCGMSGC